jgi:hypothetical protein
MLSPFELQHELNKACRRYCALTAAKPATATPVAAPQSDTRVLNDVLRKVHVEALADVARSAEEWFMVGVAAMAQRETRFAVLEAFPEALAALKAASHKREEHKATGMEVIYRIGAGGVRRVMAPKAYYQPQPQRQQQKKEHCMAPGSQAFLDIACCLLYHNVVEDLDDCLWGFVRNSCSMDKRDWCRWTACLTPRGASRTGRTIWDAACSRGTAKVIQWALRQVPPETSLWQDVEGTVPMHALLEANWSVEALRILSQWALRHPRAVALDEATLQALEACRFSALAIEASPRVRRLRDMLWQASYGLEHRDGLRDFLIACGFPSRQAERLLQEDFVLDDSPLVM